MTKTTGKIHRVFGIDDEGNLAICVREDATWRFFDVAGARYFVISEEDLFVRAENDDELFTRMTNLEKKLLASMPDCEVL